jgi:alpha-2-macroglobulin
MLRKIALLALSALLLLSSGGAQSQGGTPGFDALRRQAETYYEEKSFSRARELYEQAPKLRLSADELRWVEFRIADTTWRADAASPDADATRLDRARVTLEQLARTSPPDLITAEANESLGDLFSTHPRLRYQGNAQQHYLAALDCWAGSDQLELARQRYLSLVWKLTEHHGATREVLVNAVAIARSPADRARARVLLATQMLGEWNAASMERAFELLDEVIREGKGTEWYDDALYLLAERLVAWSDANANDPEFDTGYVRALALYRRIVTEFTPAQSRFHDDAIRAIEQLTKPSVSAMVDRTFLPDVEQSVLLTWRNVSRIELTLHPVDLTRDVVPDQRGNWLEQIRPGSADLVRRWTYETNDAKDLRPGREELRLNPRLRPGAYVLSAKAATATATALVLVTDAHVLVQTHADRLQVFVSHVETGEPIPNARVRVSPLGRKGAGADAQTNAEGIAIVETGEGGGVLVTAAAGSARQAWHQTYSWWPRRGETTQWRVYAFTDRPAYRPDETVQWKIITRAREGDVWRTPGGHTLDYEITSPRGEKVASGTAKLNEFGTFWSDLELTGSMPLGAYTISFRDGGRSAASAQLFRLEEYKLPEFVVTVTTPEGSQYRLGETIEAAIDASYYFGGPVANAEVEAVVYAQPFQRYWYPWRAYDWYWNDMRAPRVDSILTRETLRTDANGRAVLRIATPRDGTDTTYRIEARVVDASRREVRGEGSVRVMRHRYSVMAHPEHYIHRPGDRVSVRFKALDANDRPVQTTGTVDVVRRRWRERAYLEEKILTTSLDTDAAGEATLTFTPKVAGYYAVRWASPDGASKRAVDIVTAETIVWVADRSTTDIGFHQPGGLDIVVDRESIRSGETASVLILTPASGRWVVVTATAGTILETRVVKLNGTAQLVQLPIDDRHIPNFFVTAASVFDLRIETDIERIVVPPVEHFLDVEVRADRDQYEPRQEATLTVTTRDAAGRPVAAEVAVAVSDEAVTAIAADPAGDPRPFFFGETRDARPQISGSVNSQRYLSRREVEEREREEQSAPSPQSVRQQADMARGVVGGVAGAVMNEALTVTAAAPMIPPPPPAPVAPPGQFTAADMAGGMDVQVRADFRSTALWVPNVVTDANGAATLKFTLPEALTTWRATGRAVTRETAVGMGSSTVRTTLPLLVRLQAPRFFVAGDRAVVSAVINNNTDEEQLVTPLLEAAGPLTLSGSGTGTAIRVPAHGDARADWTLTATGAGDVKLRVTARGALHGDAMEKTFLVYEHGIDKLIARSGKLRGSEALIRLDLPKERRGTELVVQVTPTLAVAMLDALPYLLEFPYGCTEQTMSRFLPAAIVARTLTTLGLDPQQRLPQSKLDAVTAAGMARLYDMQHADGAWGWWKESPADDFMTAYVIWGFAVARDGQLPVNRSAVDRAAAWLERRLVEKQGRFDDQAWMLHALSAWRGKPTAAERKAFDEIWANRERLSAYSRALYALTAHRYGEGERARLLVRNLEDGVKIDRTPDQSVLLKGESAAETMSTAHWGADRFWWRWYESPVETTAFVLRALVTIDPDHRLVEPAMNWLVKNRRGAQWSNTRDTAISLLALNDYLLRSGELRGDIAYDVTVNGRVVATRQLTAADVLREPSRFTIDPSLLGATAQEIRIRKTAGSGALYFSAEARFFSLEEPVKAAGNEMFVRREYFRLSPRPTLLKGVQYDRVPLLDGQSLRSGERVEVVATVDVKNDYSYLIFEDLKPAGLEAIELQSGQPLYATNTTTKRSAYVYQELRDRKVAMFVDQLAQGVWEIRYTLRAETPGHFHALPLLGQAMYVPDIRANGDEVRLTVEERE